MTSGLALIANPKALDARERFITSVSFISGTLETIFFMQDKIEEKKEVDVEARRQITEKLLQASKELKKK